MTTHIKACITTGEAAGWSGEALQRLVIDPKSATTEGFTAVLKDAAEIRALAKFVSVPETYDKDAIVNEFVARGVGIADFRASAINLMAEIDEATAVDTTRRVNPAGSSDPYQARAAEIDAHKGKR
ncbi:MAG: hypothetical protein ACOH2K_09605 [Burkholderiaceae bacterium]